MRRLAHSGTTAKGNSNRTAANAPHTNHPPSYNSDSALANRACVGTFRAEPTCELLPPSVADALTLVAAFSAKSFPSRLTCMLGIGAAGGPSASPACRHFRRLRDGACGTL